MIGQYSRYWLLGALLFSAGESAEDAAAAPVPSSPPAGEVTVLPPLEVTATRENPLAKELREHDREAEGEKTAERAHRHGLLSRVLNGWKLPLFTSKLTADRLAEGSSRRAEIMDLERGLIVAIHQAETKEEKRALKADLAALRDLRRVTVAADKRTSGP